MSEDSLFANVDDITCISHSHVPNSRAVCNEPDADTHIGTRAHTDTHARALRSMFPFISFSLFPVSRTT